MTIVSTQSSSFSKLVNIDVVVGAGMFSSKQVKRIELCVFVLLLCFCSSVSALGNVTKESDLKSSGINMLKLVSRIANDDP
jgi:hypothetical protein